MPLTKAVEEANKFPPLAASYHFIEMPDADRLVTVGNIPEQNVWVALPVGAPGVILTTAVTSSLDILSHPVTV